MGYWENEKQQTRGDGPADIMGDAIDQVIAEFTEDMGRAPTKAEIREGLEFSLAAMDELKEE
jgi:hypothetical protein